MKPFFSRSSLSRTALASALVLSAWPALSATVEVAGVKLDRKSVV